MTTYRLMDGAAGRPGNGPSTATSYTGNYLAGTAFQVTAWNLWFEGFWWWVCGSGQQTGSQSFALWQVDDNAGGQLIQGSTVTSGALTAGAWNYIALSAPIPLSAGVPYVAATGYASTSGFPQANNQFGSGDTYSAGITNGPLVAYSSTSGSAPAPNKWVDQGLFGTASSDPAGHMPNEGYDSDNFWVDLQVSDVAPADTSYRLWPSLPNPPGRIADSALNFTLATEFSLSENCTLGKIWFYSPAGVSQLPTACGIWDVSSRTLVTGTSNSSPAWSGAAGSGWVYCDYSAADVSLTEGSNYKVAVANGAAIPTTWNSATIDYWSTGDGAEGITSGPLTAPNEASATSPGQSTYNYGAGFTYPDTYDTGGAPTYWVDVEVIPSAASSNPPPPTGTSVYRLFPSIDGPSSPVSYTGNFIAGLAFFVTGEAWFQGYWWWVCGSGQSTSPVKCALWQAPSGTGATLVPGSIATSGELAAGQWNWIPLNTPLPLSIGAAGAEAGVAQYIAAIGCNGSFPDTNNSFGSGDPYSAGITSGPLNAFSAPSGTLPSPFGIDQGLFTTSGGDPAVTPPLGGDSGHDNFWVDVQVTSTAPAGVSYRLWPSFPTIPATTNADNFEQTMGTEFILSGPCTLNNIWYYSPPGSTQLPTRCGIWNVETQQVVSGTDDTAPSWSGPAASGWISCSYSGVNLPAGDYKVTVYTPGGSDNFYQETEDYFGGGGPASSAGISYGPLSAPDTAKATAPGQTTYQHGGWLYPETYDTDFDGQTRWVDVEVTPHAASSATPAHSGTFLIFFP